MKNKIITIMLLVAIVVPIFNYNSLEAYSLNYNDTNYDISQFDSLIEDSTFYLISVKNNIFQLNFVPNNFSKNGNISKVEVYPVENTTHGTYALRCIDVNGDTCYWKSATYDVSTGKYSAPSGSSPSVITPINFTGKNIVDCSLNIYNDDGTIYFKSPSVDDTIGDPNSDLQLSYKYNEDFSECHINATLKNGAFTDKIYYSNIPPSIAGQGLITKNGFPTERFNSYRKSISIFSSGR